MLLDPLEGTNLCIATSTESYPQLIKLSRAISRDSRLKSADVSGTVSVSIFKRIVIGVSWTVSVPIITVDTWDRDGP
jgi:hypothetical protein